MTDPGAISRLRAMLLREAGQALDENKEYLVEARLGPLARELGVTLAALVDLAGRNPDTKKRVVEAMCIHETSWFRDQQAFECLRTEVLPALAESRRSQRRLSIWSAACSTGQEPYTLAMMCADMPELATYKINILATDISTVALDRCRSGRYSQLEIGRGMPASQLVRWFSRRGADWVASDQLRKMVTFKQLNLATPFPYLGGPFDLVLCRNVLIYFPVDVKRQVLGSIRREMHADGTLILGASESAVGLTDVFSPMRADKATVFKPVR